MKKMMKDMFRKLRCKKGATAVEYTLIVALMSAAIVVVLSIIGPGLRTAFETIDTTITTPVDITGGGGTGG